MEGAPGTGLPRSDVLPGCGLSGIFDSLPGVGYTRHRFKSCEKTVISQKTVWTRGGSSISILTTLVALTLTKGFEGSPPGVPRQLFLQAATSGSVLVPRDPAGVA